MDTSRWNVGDGFTILGLTAKLEFKSASSLSFALGASSDTESLPEAAELPAFLLEGGPVHIVLGWLDIHHPCEGVHRLRVRAGVPDRFVTWESLICVVKTVIVELRLPADESYYAHFSGKAEQLETWEPQTGFVSTGKWRPP